MRHSPNLFYPFFRTDLEKIRKDKIITKEEAHEEYRKMHEANRQIHALYQRRIRGTREAGKQIFEQIFKRKKQ